MKMHNQQLPGQDQRSPLPITPRTAVISTLLGIGSIATSLLALWLQTLWFPTMSLFYAYSPADRVRLFAFWFFWLGFPFCAIFSGSYARRRATSETGQQLASLGIACGYLTGIVIISILVSLFIFNSLSLTLAHPPSTILSACLFYF
jgi:hypothetical protein